MCKLVNCPSEIYSMFSVQPVYENIVHLGLYTKKMFDIEQTDLQRIRGLKITIMSKTTQEYVFLYKLKPMFKKRFI